MGVILLKDKDQQSWGSGCPDLQGFISCKKINAENVPNALIEKGQSRVIDASLTLIRERAKLKGELVRTLRGAVASTSLL
ncbi:unnamed protein product, partial [Prunus brigantina]